MKNIQSFVMEINSEKQSKSLYVLGLLFGLLIAYGLAIHLMLVTDPQQIEYREGATLYLTHQLQSSVNIYDFERQPYDLNVYGIAYYWFAAQLSSLFGTDFSPHRILTAIFIFSGCALMVWTLRAGRYGALAGLVVAGVWFAHTLRLWGIGARPDAMALLLYMLSVFLPWRLNFSRNSIIFAAGCSILAFFTKTVFGGRNHLRCWLSGSPPATCPGGVDWIAIRSGTHCIRGIGTRLGRRVFFQYSFRQHGLCRELELATFYGSSVAF